MAEVETPYWVQLERQIKGLEDNFDIKGVEIALLQSEMVDMLKPNVLLMKLTQLHLEMLMEIQEFRLKNKTTERVLKSYERLLKLLDISTQLSGLGDKAQSLKLFNKELVGRMQMLRLENSNLKKELNKINESLKF